MSYGVVETKIKTKAALKAAVASGEQVSFFGTSLFGDEPGYVTVAPEGHDLFIPEGRKLSVVGPNVYTDRRWYATVTRKNGTLKVT